MTERAIGETPPWQNLALWTAKGYRDREDYEDIAQMALIGAWQGVMKQQTGDLGTCSINRAAVVGARWKISEYMRHLPGGKRSSEIVTLSLEELMENRWESSGWDDDKKTWEPSVPDFSSSIIERETLLSYLTELTDEQRKVMLMRAQDMSIKEIAESMGKTVKHVSYMITCARKALKGKE